LTTILLVSASFGGGHDVAARRLADGLNPLGYTTRVVDLLSLLPAALGPALRRGYRIQLGVAPASWTWMCEASGRPAVGSMASSLAGLAADRLLSLVTSDTVAVVSTYPLASQLLGQLRRSGELTVPAITVLTDMSVHRLWIADGVDAHVALHRVAARAAVQLGARGVTVGGPIVPAAFRPAGPGEQRSARIAFGLPVDEPLALVVSGSWGVGQIARSAVDITATDLATPVVACGRNRTGRARLTAAGIGVPLGWVDDMAKLFRACDVVVQSGGGLSSQEALACGRPVLTYRCLPGHGRANAAALHAAGWARWIRTRTELRPALAGAIEHNAIGPQTIDPSIGYGGPAARIAEVAGGLVRIPRQRLRTDAVPASIGS
jgi:UDP-N-acetylglucosamine:LPS N-acetylglucosamine transferase